MPLARGCISNRACDLRLSAPLGGARDRREDVPVTESSRASGWVRRHSRGTCSTEFSADVQTPVSLADARPALTGARRGQSLLNGASKALVGLASLAPVAHRRDRVPGLFSLAGSRSLPATTSFPPPCRGLLFHDKKFIFRGFVLNRSRCYVVSSDGRSLFDQQVSPEGTEAPVMAPARLAGASSCPSVSGRIERRALKASLP